MLRYIGKRIFQMIPTVLGVIFITFFLFNIVGGNPAQQVLGPHAQADTLHAFDEQRGLNKPLFFGFRTATRALVDSNFKRTAGGWQNLDGVVHTNGTIILPVGGEYALPLAFDLRGDREYELQIEGRTKGFPTFGKNDLNLSENWKKTRVLFNGTDPLIIRSVDAPLEICSIRLRRVMDNPFDSQFSFYLNQLVHFDFGISHSTNQRVTRLLFDGIGPSLMLTVPIFIVGLLTSIILSLFCAFWRDTWIDRFFIVLSVALMSINYLVWIVGGQYLLGFKLGWFPVWGFENLRYLVLPILIGVFSGLGASLRFYRTIMLDETHRDYVRTAQAKGVNRTGILFKHILKNAMIPIITNVVISIPFLYTGNLLLESFFGIPGLGYLSINAINSSDIDVVRAVVLIGSILFVIANLLTDICYAIVDPRVKLI